MRNFYAGGFDANYEDLPYQDIGAQAAYGAIRQYKQEHPDAIWISASPIPGSDEDRRVWESNQSEQNLSAIDSEILGNYHIGSAIAHSLDEFGLNPEIQYGYDHSIQLLQPELDDVWIMPTDHD